VLAEIEVVVVPVVEDVEDELEVVVGDVVVDDSVVVGRLVVEDVEEELKVVVAVVVGVDDVVVGRPVAEDVEDELEVVVAVDVVVDDVVVGRPLQTYRNAGSFALRGGGTEEVVPYIRVSAAEL